MTMSKFSVFKIAFVLPVLLLPSCEEKRGQKEECNAVCEAKKADFELLTMSVNFENECLVSGTSFDFDAYKVAAGTIIARYEPFYERGWVEADLSPEEWQSFIKTLYKCLDKDLDELEVENYDGIRACARSLRIYYPDSSGYSRWQAKPTDWGKVEEAIDGMLSMIRKRTEVPLDAELRAEYQKRFGEPITEAELSTNGMQIWHISNKERKHVYFSATRTDSGAFFFMERLPVLELDIGGWLDFVRAMYRSGVGEWDRKYGGDSIPTFYKESELYEKWKIDNRWKLEIYYSDKSWFRQIEGYNAYPPNWKEFMKVINGIKAKARKKREALLEAKLKIEYQRRFREPVTDIELSTNKIEFQLVPKEKKHYRKDYYVSATRTETGVLLGYLVTYQFGQERPISIIRDVELGTGDWLDFVRAVYKSGVGEWDRKYGGDSASEFHDKWNLDLYHSGRPGFIRIEGYDSYPPNWDKFMKIMVDMDAKARKKGVK